MVTFCVCRGSEKRSEAAALPRSDCVLCRPQRGVPGPAWQGRWPPSLPGQVSCRQPGKEGSVPGGEPERPGTKVELVSRASGSRLEGGRAQCWEGTRVLAEGTSAQVDERPCRPLQCHDPVLLSCAPQVVRRAASQHQSHSSKSSQARFHVSCPRGELTHRAHSTFP